MNFQAELAAKVMAGEKTVTRRAVSLNPRSPWSSRGCKLVVGRTYAVCPGRGKNAIGRVVIVSVRLQALFSALSLAEARAEGFESVEAFQDAWRAINGAFVPRAPVWRVEFKVVPTNEGER